MSKNWTYSWQLCFLKKLPQFFVSGSSARIMGIPTTGPVVRNHIPPKMWSNYVPFVVHGLSKKFLYFIFTWFFNIFIAGFCAPHGKSSNRKKWIYGWRVTGKPVAWISRNQKNINKNEDDEELRSGLLQDVLELVQDFKENLVDKNVQPHQYSPSSTHELPMEPRAKVVQGPGKHTVSFLTSRRTKIVISAWRRK